eukprot:CAMPEP_0179211856 /NCGR_PEP_ID=MMETSP0797-20121207/732_1 /TAXON_ID=47934 /ORGANISM="Dinophysis acuminata, Strain DAEP01" /LENGTH=73 /DNA_ID=CAMNT_0020917303 /DNA_START=33 /DNA_END=250 /DNA_ORIENTATION=+
MACSISTNACQKNAPHVHAACISPAGGGMCDRMHNDVLRLRSPKSRDAQAPFSDYWLVSLDNPIRQTLSASAR